MMEHLLPHKISWTRDGWTWIILCYVQEVSYWTDCILGTDHRLLQKLAVRDPRHNTNHYMFLGFLRGFTLRENQIYFGSCTQIPLYPLKFTSHKDNILAYLRQTVSKTWAREHAHAS